MTIDELRQLLDAWDGERPVWVKVRRPSGKYEAIPVTGACLLPLRGREPHDKRNPVAIVGVKL